MGYPVAEGVYGDLGLFYASVFLIPLRLVMWSVGTGYFMAQQESRKEVLKKVLTHPCLIAVYIGILLILTQWRPPAFLDMTIRYIGGCNAAITMFFAFTGFEAIAVGAEDFKDPKKNLPGASF